MKKNEEVFERSLHPQALHGWRRM